MPAPLSQRDDTSAARAAKAGATTCIWCWSRSNS